MTVYTWLLEICSTNAFGDFNVAFCTSIFVFQCCMEYGKKPLLTALAEGLMIRKYLDKFPDKYSGTCVLWTPWDRQKVSRLSRCPDFPGHFI